ncbi:hypothetical protein RIF29_31205 [Crotalaria pallida]|uniref:Uncharacterized protein n=1 Tax=Crotalaria pallida TaxID=3830 RepID=A0AAN9EHA4_CROPI
MLVLLIYLLASTTARPLSFTTKYTAKYHSDKDQIHRSTLERAAHHVKEEPSEIGSMQENFVDIDYEKPHPKPPIHNRSPPPASVYLRP